MLYNIELVEPIAVYYPTNSGARLRAIFCGIPDSTDNPLDEFWFKNGFPCETPVDRFPQVGAGSSHWLEGKARFTEFEQKKLYFVFVTPDDIEPEHFATGWVLNSRVDALSHERKE